METEMEMELEMEMEMEMAAPFFQSLIRDDGHGHMVVITNNTHQALVPFYSPSTLYNLPSTTPGLLASSSTVEAFHQPRSSE